MRFASEDAQVFTDIYIFTNKNLLSNTNIYILYKNILLITLGATKSKPTLIIFRCLGLCMISLSSRSCKLHKCLAKFGYSQSRVCVKTHVDKVIYARIAVR